MQIKDFDNKKEKNLKLIGRLKNRNRNQNRNQKIENFTHTVSTINKKRLNSCNSNSNNLKSITC